MPLVFFVTAFIKLAVWPDETTFSVEFVVLELALVFPTVFELEGAHPRDSNFQIL